MSNSLIKTERFSLAKSLHLPELSARNFFFKTLEKFEHGQIQIIEGQESFSFGHAEDNKVHAQIYIHDTKTYSSILIGGSIGMAEAYMQGYWTTDNLAAVIQFFSRNLSIAEKLEGPLSKIGQALFKLRYAFERNSISGSKKNIVAHYDLGNDFFKLFLDDTMMYSMAIFQDKAKNDLHQAQLHKLKTICDKLELSQDDHLLEIGTGWGGLAAYAAENYGCKVTTTTISEEQYAYAKEQIQSKNLEDKVTLLKKDYRLLEGSFDKMVSIEMIEAVGHQYFDQYFETCSHLLKPDGLFLMQVITIPDQRFHRAIKEVDFIKRYIFPGCCIPSIQALSTSAMKKSSFRIINLQDYAEDYADTLKAWNLKFQNNKEQALKLTDETFFRMWEMYLAYCEGGFRERIIGCSQILFAKEENRS